MDAKQTKKEVLRKQIIAAAKVYKDELAGKVFLYVYGEEYFEICFRTDSFMHLTGVDSALNSKQFYKYSRDGLLTNNQFYFSKKHPYAGAKDKLSCLTSLPVLTNSIVCVVKDMTTLSLTYKIGVTNLNFTLGLTENTDTQGNKINDLFFPRTLRVRDDSIARSRDGDIVDFIFMRDASVSSYETMMYNDKSKNLTKSIRHLLDPKFYSSNRFQ